MTMLRNWMALCPQTDSNPHSIATAACPRLCTDLMEWRASFRHLTHPLRSSCFFPTWKIRKRPILHSCHFSFWKNTPPLFQARCEEVFGLQLLPAEVVKVSNRAVDTHRNVTHSSGLQIRSFKKSCHVLNAQIPCLPWFFSSKDLLPDSAPSLSSSTRALPAILSPQQPINSVFIPWSVPPMNP